MKNNFVISLVLCFSSMSMYGQTIQSFVPDGWVIFEQTFGDLNKDSIEDAAVIIEKTTEPASENGSFREIEKDTNH